MKMPKIIILTFILSQIVFSMVFSNEPSKSAVSVQNAFPNLKFKNPVDLTFADDGSNRIFVVEKRGRIQVFENDSKTTAASVFLDISTLVHDSGECGLLGLTFHPKFKTNGYFFVNYTTKKPVKTIIARFEVDPKNKNQALPESFLSILEIDQPYENHNGGQIVFGPDGFLYIGMGDGGSGGDPKNFGQNLNSLLGKMLRIDIDKPANGLHYSIPASNPFVKKSPEIREEIYAYGLRNPWRFSFDTKTKKLWCADVGQNLWEEISIITSGGNFGWKIMEGKNRFNNSKDDTTKLIPPVFEYKHTDGNCSITGGFVYYGKKVNPFLGHYIYGDYCSKNVWKLNTNNYQNSFVAVAPSSINAFGVDSKNELYMLCNDGIIYEFVPNNN